jgi:hypothetical protein
LPYLKVCVTIIRVAQIKEIPVNERTLVKKEEKDVPSAHRNIFVCDQGHYGSASCSNCAKDLKQDTDYCPHCGAKFSEKDITAVNRGGSDF